MSYFSSHLEEEVVLDVAGRLAVGSHGERTAAASRARGKTGTRSEAGLEEQSWAQWVA